MSKMTELKGLLLIDTSDKSNVIISGVIMYVTVPSDLKGLNDLGQFPTVPCSLYDHLACFIPRTKCF